MIADPRYFHNTARPRRGFCRLSTKQLELGLRRLRFLGRLGSAPATASANVRRRALPQTHLRSQPPALRRPG
jgi:hypothetical protein